MFLQVKQPEKFPLTCSHDKGIDPQAYFKCLTGDIRLRTIVLTHQCSEICVCELMEALSEQSQPKVPQNLAILKNADILLPRKHGQWVFYR